MVRETMPALTEQLDEGTRELVQTSVWLVGLATGFLGVFLAKPETLVATGILARPLVASALSVIVLGVVLRVIQQVVSAKERVLMHMVRSSLAAFSEPSTDPQPLFEGWSIEEICRRLRDDLDMDPSRLLKAGASLDILRATYIDHFKIWAEFELHRQQDLGDLFRAMSGLPAIDRDAPVADAAFTDPFSQIRVAATSIKRWTFARNALYFSTALAFIATASLVAAVLLG